MNTYRSPVYPALMINLGDGRKVKAAGGYFEVEDEDVSRFEEIMRERPQYRIVQQSRESRRDEGVTGTMTSLDGEPAPTTAAGDPHGTVTQPEPMSAAERHPELVTVETLEALNVPTLRERLQGLGLDDTGRKAVLVRRLAEATNTPTGDDATEGEDSDDEDLGSATGDTGDDTETGEAPADPDGVDADDQV